MMTNAHFLNGRRRWMAGLLFAAGLALYTALSAATQAGAQGEVTTQAVTDVGDAGGLADLFVSEIQGTTIQTDAGIVIDLTHAIVFSIGGERLDASAIKAGTRIRASLVKPDDAASPMVAKFVEVRLDSEIVLVAPVQAIDLASGSLTLLNRQIHFGQTPPIVTSADRKKMKVGRTITVVAKAEATGLVALRIYLGNEAAFAGAAFL